MKANTYSKALAALSLILAAAFVQAADGDAEQGALIGYSCLGCHGIDGYRNAYPSYRVPKLGGQKPAYIENALIAYRDGARQHPTMQAQGGSLSDSEISNVAAWLATYGQASDAANADTAVDAVQTCIQCHGQDAAPVVPTPPVISGQHLDYIVHALGQYKNGSRSGTVMSAFVAAMSEEDIAAAAQFYSSLEGLSTTKVDRD